MCVELKVLLIEWVSFFVAAPFNWIQKFFISSPSLLLVWRKAFPKVRMHFPFCFGTICLYLQCFNFVCCYACFLLNNSYWFFNCVFGSFYFPGLSTKKHHAGKFFSLLLLCMFVLVLFVSICNVLILFVVMHVSFLIIIIFSYWFLQF